MDTPTDSPHPDDIRAAASAFGRMGGSVKSERKTAAVRANLAKARAARGAKFAEAARANGRKGGRPRKPREGEIERGRDEGKVTGSRSPQR